MGSLKGGLGSQLGNLFNPKVLTPEIEKDNTCKEPSPFDEDTIKKTDEIVGKNSKYKRRQANLNDDNILLSDGDVLPDTKNCLQNKSVASNKDEFFPIVKEDGRTSESPLRSSRMKVGGNTIRSSKVGEGGWMNEPNKCSSPLMIKSENNTEE